MKREEALFNVSDRGNSMIKMINEIYDDFESRTCESCKFYTKTTQKNHICNLNHDIWHLDRGCEQWEKQYDL